MSTFELNQKGGVRNDVNRKTGLLDSFTHWGGMGSDQASGSEHHVLIIPQLIIMEIVMESTKNLNIISKHPQIEAFVEFQHSIHPGDVSDFIKWIFIIKWKYCEKLIKFN